MDRMPRDPEGRFGPRLAPLRALQDRAATPDEAARYGHLAVRYGLMRASLAEVAETMAVQFLLHGQPISPALATWLLGHTFDSGRPPPEARSGFERAIIAAHRKINEEAEAAILEETGLAYRDVRAAAIGEDGGYAAEIALSAEWNIIAAVAAAMLAVVNDEP